jgi:hypothetical protein
MRDTVVPPNALPVLDQPGGGHLDPGATPCLQCTGKDGSDEVVADPHDARCCDAATARCGSAMDRGVAPLSIRSRA